MKILFLIAVTFSTSGFIFSAAAEPYSTQGYLESTGDEQYFEVYAGRDLRHPLRSKYLDRRLRPVRQPAGQLRPQTG